MGYLKRCHLVDANRGWFYNKAYIAGFYDYNLDTAFVLLDNIKRIRRFNIDNIFDAVICVINHETMHKWTEEEWPLEKIEEHFGIYKKPRKKPAKKQPTNKKSCLKQ